MAAKSNSSAGSTAGPLLATALALIAITTFFLSSHVDRATAHALEKQEPELNRPLEEIAPVKPAREAISREDESWDKFELGTMTLELPGNPSKDPKPGWFSQYAKVKTLAAYRAPVEHRLSHVRVSAIRYSSGNISLSAAALAAKHGMDSELSGITTIFPFKLHDLTGRHLSSRPTDEDDLTRMHTYLVLNNHEMLILTVTGHNEHPNQLAQQILETIEIPSPTTAALEPAP